MITTDPIDARWMTRALIHAWTLGRHSARPNPMVGAVLARGEELLAAGAHAQYGEAHAERACLDAWDGPVPDDATLYVSLEPCSHHGRQPPCSELLIERGVKRVVIGCADPHPQTHGIGPRQLTEAGVDVVWADATLAQRAVEMNRGFQRVHRDGRPEMFAKFAITANGRFTTGTADQRWISGPAARAEVQQLRAASSAILVGVGTVIADNPMLTVRDVAVPEHAIPWRIVLDRTLRTPPESILLDTAHTEPVVVMTCEPVSGKRRRALEQRGARVVVVTGGDGFLHAACAELARLQLNDVLVEAGPTLVDALWRADLIDRVRCYRSPHGADPQLPGLDPDHPLLAALTHVRSVAQDDVLEADLHPLTPLEPSD